MQIFFCVYAQKKENVKMKERGNVGLILFSMLAVYHLNIFSHSFFLSLFPPFPPTNKGAFVDIKLVFVLRKD